MALSLLYSIFDLEDDKGQIACCHSSLPNISTRLMSTLQKASYRTCSVQQQIDKHPQTTGFYTKEFKTMLDNVRYVSDWSLWQLDDIHAACLGLCSCCNQQWLYRHHELYCRPLHWLKI